MQPILSVSAMRLCDEKTIHSGTDSKILMYRAGESIFRSRTWNGSISIVTGSGNNAGDGYVIALLLHEAGIPCRLVRLSEKCSPDGAYYFEKCLAAGIPCTSEPDFTHTDIIVDCILGTGFHGSVRPDIRDAIEKINASSARIVSVDINSGMNGDTGAGGCCVRSHETISIGFVKYGHLIGMARGIIGTLKNYDIGIPCTEDSTPFFTAGETPDFSADFSAMQTVFLHAEDFSADCGDTLREQMRSFAEKEQCLLVLYHTAFIMLCDGVQCCGLAHTLSEEACRRLTAECGNTLSVYAKAVLTQSCTEHCPRILFG
ncbi:MAG: NAD(P)H-hydrate epimerase [Ruminococcus sp.]|nr:NAD(P)H-hydrate epimerase [Ruminococcus sp.]